jgi:glycerol-1-phosphate dehydrogenase [NAD(P)+]
MVTRNLAQAGSAEDDRCVCGAVHRVPIDVVVINEDALEQLVAYGKGHRWSRPFVVMDANTEEVAGSRVVEELSRANMHVASLCFPERSGLLADETSVSQLEAALNDLETDSVVAVGSGVITDITRYVTSRTGREFVSVPTAASMDGYASSVAAMEFGGIKTTYPAATPVAIFADPDTIAAAPLDMTRAGLGDLLGKASAGADWMAAHALYGEQFCTEVERRVTEPLLHAASHTEDILAGSPEAVSRLLRGLIESGIAMAMVGTSRPASGCEHHASHFWDLLAANGRRPHHPHGLQVGYATHFAMRLQVYAFGGGIRELIPPRPIASDGDDARVWFTGHDGQVEAVMAEKRRFVDEHAPAWPATASRWEAAQEQIREATRPFPLVAEALLAAGIPSEPGFIGLDTETLKVTFRWANRIRSRYTVLDFLEGQGRLADAIDSVLPV